MWDVMIVFFFKHSGFCISDQCVLFYSKCGHFKIIDSRRNGIVSKDLPNFTVANSIELWLAHIKRKMPFHLWINRSFSDGFSFTFLFLTCHCQIGKVRICLKLMRNFKPDISWDRFQRIGLIFKLSVSFVVKRENQGYRIRERDAAERVYGKEVFNFEISLPSSHQTCLLINHWKYLFSQIDALLTH